MGLGAGDEGPNLPGMLAGIVRGIGLPGIGNLLTVGAGPGGALGGRAVGPGKLIPGMNGARGPFVAPGGTGDGTGVALIAGGTGSEPGLGSPVGFGRGGSGVLGGLGLPRLPDKPSPLMVASLGGGPGGLGVPGGLGIDATKSVPGGLYVGVSGTFDMPMGVTTGDYQADAPGMLNLMAQLRERTNVHVTVEERFVPLTMANIEHTPILHLRGHRPFAFTDEERKTLRQYVAQGGTIFGEDSHGPFGECFRREMKKIFGVAPADLPADHDLYRAHYVLDRVPAGDMGERYPLQGIEIGDRLGVIFSRNDYGDCWEGTGAWVRPESREPAFKMGTNIFTYVVAHWKRIRGE